MLFRLKECISHTQMRQFAMFHTNNRTQLKMKTIYHWEEPKYSNIINPSLNLHRLLHSQDQNSLPPLMFGSTSKINIFKMMLLYFVLNSSIDPGFRMQDFILGARQAVMVISTALNMQDYEALNGIVKEKAIKILRHRVDRLAPKQRDLLILHSDSFILFPHFIKLRKIKDSKDAVVQIGIRGFSVRNISLNVKSFVYINYVFERTYKNGIGGEWIARLVSHASLKSTFYHNTTK